MDEEKAEYFEYLDGLRESGVTNMFGAALYLERAFPDLEGKKATLILLEWMNQF